MYPASESCVITAKPLAMLCQKYLPPLLWKLAYWSTTRGQEESQPDGVGLNETDVALKRRDLRVLALGLAPNEVETIPVVFIPLSNEYEMRASAGVLQGEEWKTIWAKPSLHYGG